ncbi:MAG: hypothetical protein Q4F00_03750 [bacterium]|nr:hypothetical protein [bacterium]
MNTEWSADPQYPYVTMDELGHLLDEEGTIIFGEKRMLLLGRAQGRAQGHAEGHAKGRAESMLNDLKNLMETMNLTADNAMNALRVPESERSKFRRMLETDE